MSTAAHPSTGFLALELDGDGGHPAAWRKARHAPAELLDGTRVRATVLAAESAGFHVATFADGSLTPASSEPGGRDIPGRLNALQRAAFAGPVTGSIVLVPEVDTVYTEPFHISTQLASLDYVSGGRAGWLVAASDQAADAAAVGRSFVPADGLGREAADSIEVGHRLWDSWEDDAVIRDVATGRYIDADKLHYVDFESVAGYSVKGPSIIPRPLQGQLPVLAPAGLLSADQLSAGAADAVLVSAPTPELLAGEIAEARAAAPAAAIIAELDVVLDARGQSAAGRLAELDAHTPWRSSRARFVGTAAELTGLLASVLETADGVRLHPAVLDVDLEELAQLVLPALRRQGVLAPRQPGSTFRDLLGLPRPASRYAAVSAPSVTDN
ncbi:LLM class flavin-dependent oxidoreductase [Arthrobacter globiformis]|uniref:LLM class flavin-dependent oxidoreductase n=1 Tax=Arthrobacter globiformis TaxID=1665 RepID=UPI0027847C23|nr:LLM class flavin-dependent oxidoreductase [Arthrobacter globiformis]MDQ0862934.1 alkanesulfonate monooxygenase SsuD/methylene tetrahydromethanopterin reductase-like flavin-dependent oxidoreductase (luciferase family) [Arthrobacter globiformis]